MIMKRLLRQMRLALAVAQTGSFIEDRVTLLLWAGYIYCADAFKLSPITIRPSLRINTSHFRVTLKNLSDLWVLKDVLIDREYDVPELPEVSTVVDLGCNIGISSLFFAARFPGVRIYAIEPNPVIMEQLRDNTENVEGISVHALALADVNGPVPFAVEGRAISGSLAKAGTSSVMVEGVTADQLLVRLGVSQIDLLKFDIEGAERNLFVTGLGTLNPKVALGEMHYDLGTMTPLLVREGTKAYEMDERFIRGADRSIVCFHKKQQH